MPFDDCQSVKKTSCLYEKATDSRWDVSNYETRIARVLISEGEIASRVSWAAARISEEYAGKPLLIVGSLNGSFIFMADLCKAISIPCEIAFVRAKSYVGTESSGSVSIELDVSQDLSKYHVVIVEDIIDTGRTLRSLTGMYEARNPLSLKVVTLLDKPSRREVNMEPDMALFTIPDLFVIGYGLDCDERYRNLPYVAEYAAE